MLPVQQVPKEIKEIRDPQDHRGQRVVIPPEPVFLLPPEPSPIQVIPMQTMM